MKIETAPQYEDTSLEDRPSKTLEAILVNTRRGESSVNIGDNAPIEIDLCRNSKQEWWLLRTVFEDERVYKDFDPNKPNLELRERWTGEMNRVWTSDTRVVAFTAEAPAGASPCDIGDALIEAYESAGGDTGDDSQWSQHWD
jgi:hypothetical protein